ncbi:hypothetical protein L7F22_030925 [Adiantum nelumboides]|nr:hypothetical protein [Adiantum nelumboides]
MLCGAARSVGREEARTTSLSLSLCPRFAMMLSLGLIVAPSIVFLPWYRGQPQQAESPVFCALHQWHPEGAELPTVRWSTKTSSWLAIFNGRPMSAMLVLFFCQCATCSSAGGRCRLGSMHIRENAEPAKHVGFSVKLGCIQAASWDFRF